MTMVITMIRPEGIWQSADNRVTLRGRVIDDAASKQLDIMCPPVNSGGPRILLGFTGLAEFPDGTPTMQWLRETLRGENRVIMSMFDHMRDRLSRDVGSSSLWRNPLVFSGGIFEGEKRFYVEVRNVDVKTLCPVRKFEYVIREVTQPMIFIAGSGQFAVEPRDLELLTAQAKIRPAKWEDHLGLLAAVNRRTAKHTNTVSPWCQVTFLSSETPGAKSKLFTKPGEPEKLIGVGMLIAGFDTSEIATLFAKHIQQRKIDITVPPPDFDEANRRSVEGRQ